MAIITIIFAAVLPQFRVIYNGWDSRQAGTEVLQNGRVLIDHISRNLSKAVKITAVSNSTEPNGFIVFQDNDGNNWRYDINTTSRYVEFGLVGNLSDLAGPVSSLKFTCYDGNNFTNAITDGNSIRFVKAETTLVNSVSASRNKTLIASAYLRTNSNVGNWCAYNDCVFDPGLVGDGNDPCGNSVHYGDTNRITVFGIGTLASDLQTSLGAVGYSASSGKLKNYATGASTGVTATLTQSGGVVWQPMVGSVAGQNWSGGYDTAVCTDAYNTFHGIADMTGVIYYGSAGWWVDVNFTGLDPNKSYTFATSASRAKSTTDGAPGYTDRYSVYTISGIDAATNASTPGTDVNGGNPYSVRFNTGNNHDEGYVARWTGINPGADGTFNVRATAAPDANAGYKAYAFDVFELQSVETIAQIAYPISYEGFTEAKVSSDSTSITIPTPGSSGAVAILGSWVTGLTHAKETGTNRALIFIAHGEDNDDPSIVLSSVSYGGRAMTKVVEGVAGGVSPSSRTYVAVFQLDESNIVAATSTTFSVTWNQTPDDANYESVFLQNVNQTTPVGATANNGTTSGDTITTAALATSSGDLVVDAATCSNIGSYTTNNSFTEALEVAFSLNSTDGVVGYKFATGANETPSVTHSTTNGRQSLIGFVVNVNEEVSGIEGDLLIAAVATDGSSTPFTGIPSGWTQIDCTAYGTAVTLGAWWKIAGDPEPASHTFTWTGGQQAYGWMMCFTGHDANNPINASATANQTSATPTSPAVTTTAGCSMILRLGAFDDGDVNTLPEPGNPGLSGHTPITMDESAASSAGAVTYQGFAEAKVTSDLTSIIVPVPTGTASGDLLIAAVATDGGSLPFSPPSGWTLIQSDSNGTEVTLGVWYIVAGGSEPSSYTFSWTGGQQAYGWIMRFSGADTTSPINISATTKGSGSATPPCPSVTTTVANTMIVRVGGFDRAFITVDAPGLSGHTAITMDQSTPDVVGHCSGGAGYIQQPAIGASGTSNFALTASEQYVTVTLAISPAAVTGTVSGGAGYKKQSASGGSGTSTFSLTASNEARMLTIAIAPAGGNSGYDCCGNYIQP